MLPLLAYDVLPAATSFRVMTLHPGIENASLYCNLSIVDIANPPSYEALSYVWGDIDEMACIECDHQLLRITSNLAKALRRLRLTDQAILLWTDSICINQQDLAERSQQVALMGKIYSKCTQVAVWLGDSDAGTAYAFEFIAEQGHRIRRLMDENSEKFLRAEMPDVTLEEVANLDQKVLNAVTKLCDKPWWSRIWCIQEVGLAPKRRIMCGPYELDWDSLMTFTGYISGYGDVLTLFNRWEHLVLFWRSWAHFTAYKNEWKQYLVSGPLSMFAPDFLEILDHTFHHSASDERDKIYGLFGHPSAQHEGSTLIVPDYTKSYDDICLELAIVLLRLQHAQHAQPKLRLLSFVCHENPLESFHGRPSWVPTWNYDEYCATLGNGDNYYDTGGMDKTVQIQIFGKELLLEGLLVDEIVFHSDTLPLEGFKIQPYSTSYGLQQINSLWRNTIDLHQNGDAQSNESLHDAMTALSITLCAGLINGKPAEESVPVHFRNLEAYMIATRDANWGNSKSGLFNQAFLDSKLHASSAESGDPTRYMLDMYEKGVFRKLFSTSGNRFGLGPACLRTGDLCFVIFGAKVPFVLRKDGETYKLIGEAYLHGIMRRQALKMWRDGVLQAQVLRIS